MGFNCGIVGLPNVGKSTIFNALTSAGAQASNYPFTTIDPNVGVVDMPDERLQTLAVIYQPKKLTPTTMEFVDIAGLVKGASQGEGLGNKFLANIREVDAIAHVVRCFEDPNVIHVAGAVDPKADIEVIEAELMLADLDAIEKRLFKSEKLAKTGDKKVADETAFMKRIKDMLSRGEPVRRASHSDDEAAWLKSYNLLSAKPVLYVANVAEDMVNKPNPMVDAVRRIAAEEGAMVVVISGQVEGEIAQLPAEERKEYLAGMGLKESGLDRMIRAGYELLGLITYFTAGEKEVRAWTITKGTKAPQAAGKIHTDFEKGFIRAEVFHYDDLMKLKTEQAVKAAGLLRSEGKDYVVKDGDIMLFRFNVYPDQSLHGDRIVGADGHDPLVRFQNERAGIDDPCLPIPHLEEFGKSLRAPSAPLALAVVNVQVHAAFHPPALSFPGDLNLPFLRALGQILPGELILPLVQERVVERFGIMVVHENERLALVQPVKGLEDERMPVPGDDRGYIQCLHGSPPCGVHCERVFSLPTLQYSTPGKETMTCIMVGIVPARQEFFKEGVDFSSLHAIIYTAAKGSSQARGLYPWSYQREHCGSA